MDENIHKPSEKELIHKTQMGDEKAFIELITPYQEMVKRHCLKLGLDSAGAEDVAQEIFIQAFRKINKFEMRSKFSTWLYRISRNLSLNYLRNRNRRKENVYNDQVFSSGPAIVYSEDRNFSDDFQKMIEDALEILPEGHRIVFKMYEIEKIPQKVIAEKLRLKPGTVRSRLHYARKKLKKYFEDHAETLKKRDL